jgi:hypothetical protein
MNSGVSTSLPMNDHHVHAGGAQHPDAETVGAAAEHVFFTRL